MNKKKYISPNVVVIPFETEGMLAASLQIGSTPGGEQLSNEKEWNDSEWSEPDGYWE